MKRQVLSKPIRDKIGEVETVEAILITANSLEHLFFMKLFFEKGIKYILIENWTLGRYIDWVIKLNLVDKKYEQLLKDFNLLRTQIVHRFSNIYRIQNSGKTWTAVFKLILKICDFLDETEVIYKQDSELEKKYGEFLNKLSKKLDNLLEKYSKD